MEHVLSQNVADTIKLKTHKVRDSSMMEQYIPFFPSVFIYSKSYRHVDVHSATAKGWRKFALVIISVLVLMTSQTLQSRIIPSPDCNMEKSMLNVVRSDLKHRYRDAFPSRKEEWRQYR